MTVKLYKYILIVIQNIIKLVITSGIRDEFEITDVGH